MSTGANDTDPAAVRKGPRQLLATLPGDPAPARAPWLAAMLAGFGVALGQGGDLASERERMRDVARDAVAALWGRRRWCPARS